MEKETQELLLIMMEKQITLQKTMLKMLKELNEKQEKEHNKFINERKK